MAGSWAQATEVQPLQQVIDAIAAVDHAELRLARKGVQVRGMYLLDACTAQGRRTHLISEKQR